MDWTPFNPFFTWLLRSPLHWLVDPGLTLLTVTGRRSGRRYSIPVGYQRDGDVIVVMVSDAPAKQWWRSYRTPGPVELRLWGRTVRGEALVVSPGSEEFRRRAAATFRRLPVLGRQFGIAYDRRAGLSDAQLAHLGVTAAIVRVTLDANHSSEPRAGGPGRDVRKPMARWRRAGWGCISILIASKTPLNCASYFRSSASTLRARTVYEVVMERRRTNARMISMLTCTARLLWSTLDNMATPCSVKACGR